MNAVGLLDETLEVLLLTRSGDRVRARFGLNLGILLHGSRLRVLIGAVVQLIDFGVKAIVLIGFLVFLCGTRTTSVADSTRPCNTGPTSVKDRLVGVDVLLMIEEEVLGED